MAHGNKGRVPVNGFDKNPQNINRKGRPPGSSAVRQALKDAIMKKITFDDVADIVIQEAKDGDLKAIQMLLDYTAGKAITEIRADVEQTNLNIDDIGKLINFKEEE